MDKNVTAKLRLLGLVIARLTALRDYVATGQHAEQRDELTKQQIALDAE